MKINKVQVVELVETLISGFDLMDENDVLDISADKYVLNLEIQSPALDSVGDKKTLDG